MPNANSASAAYHSYKWLQVQIIELVFGKNIINAHLRANRYYRSFHWDRLVAKTCGLHNRATEAALTVIATWNVNSVRARLPRVLEWLDEFEPDVALLQELKATDETFPWLEIEDRGYNVEIHGQKNFNGVGILSKSPIEDITRGLPNNTDDDQARYIEAFTAGFRVASIYLPNGNPAPGDKYDYKLHWMECLCNHMRGTPDVGRSHRIRRRLQYRADRRRRARSGRLGQRRVMPSREPQSLSPDALSEA